MVRSMAKRAVDRGFATIAHTAAPIRRLPSTSRGVPANILQADAYAGFGNLCEPGRLPGTILEAGCWAHWRRKFYEIAALKKAPIAVEAVTRIGPSSSCV